jgi:L-histidine Nalpha-methyltransferase
MTPSFELSRATASAPSVDAASAPIAADVLGGLLATPKTLPPKLFYDARGAALFERICELDEYYLTRTELSILRRVAPEIARLAGPRCALVEYGSGAGVKIRLLLDALDSPAAYVPIDISREQLARVAADLAADHPSVAVRPVCADYTARFDLPNLPVRARRLAFFPGSTIGNFHPMEAAVFLRRVRHNLGPDGALVLGVDRRKDVSVLHAAYNDAEGITAAFNLNLLERINRELGADFDLTRFRHRALFNDEASRIEMHLESVGKQDVHLAGQRIRFEDGETIWTESSYKYDRERLEQLVNAAGFRITRLWSDDASLFWVAFLSVAVGDDLGPV